MDSEQPPSIQMIADEVGLSKATVSRVLRNVPGHKAETRDKIIKAAEKAGLHVPPYHVGGDVQRSLQENVSILPHHCRDPLPTLGTEASLEHGSAS